MTRFRQVAEAYLGQGELAKAMACVQYAIEQEEVDILPDSYRTIGEIQLTQGQPEDALEPINRSIKLTQDSGDLYLGGYAWRALAQVQAALNDDEQTGYAQKRAIELFEQINLPNEVDKTKRILK